jgi:hypothetical protein
MENINNYDLPKHMVKAALRQAEDELRAQHLAGNYSEGDPNHPMYHEGFDYASGEYVDLFGYNQKDFMLKQYK